MYPPGWYEPLVSPLQNNDKAITFPVVDVIDPNSFAVMEQSTVTLVGSLHLYSLLFTWLEDRGYTSETTIKSSTMPGSVFAISKKWFSHLGMFDPYLQVWGGENIEMSFKAWMCGGGIFIATCSHVAHLPRRPVNVKSHTALLNSARVAEVWMDEFKQYFYEKTAFHLAWFNHTNIDSRKELRRSLKCKNFRWYLTKVSPDLYNQIDEYSFYLGQIKNKQYDVCLDSKHNYVSPEVTECSPSFSQVWLLRTDGRLTCHGSMLIAQPGSNEDDLRVTTVPLNSSWTYDNDLNHQWEYDKLDRIVHKKSRLCLGVRKMAQLTLDLTHCTTKMTELKWLFNSRKDFYKQHNQTLMTSVMLDDDL
ncbi:Polypeptide N-acetylgalactosaminyltransferase 12 [Bulinus truncatus]|nr:Polypeptide N-acetylgalactosaminyltransferase 12 [Bulinus truncatus]